MSDTIPERRAGRDIVDAHHHIWDTDRNYHPWLRDEPMIPFRYGDYSAIRRPYSPDEYRRDAEPWNLVASVYVETEWDRSDETGEMDYLASVMAENTLPSVAVAHATLDAPTAPAVLESHAARPFVRGIRHKPRANAAPRDATPGGMTEPSWRENFARLEKLGLRYDVQTPWWHFTELAALATAFPNSRIIVNHTGLPADRSPDAISAWKAAMHRAAACPNISVKISGLGQRGQKWTADANRDIVLTTIDLFGTDRCMFASNFPVDSLCATFAEIYGGFEDIVRKFTPAEQDALFADNARRIYDIR
ncbi:MAG TPA: amidohydrolase family protein [Hyphomicrobiaceae bacterium]|nr:amidohydrolase family protein [Hyphomicrobiaceae bacterium]